MDMEQRKITYRMYPKASEEEKLLEYLGLLQRLYNTALEERILHYKETGKSLGYNTYGDGWKLFQNQITRSKTGKPEFKNGKVRLSGIGERELRGRGRFIGSPKTAEVIRKQDKWYLSVTYNVEAESVARQRGTDATALNGV